MASWHDVTSCLSSLIAYILSIRAGRQVDNAQYYAGDG
jgi:hypothetical protein